MSENRRKFIRIDSGNSPCKVTIGTAQTDALLVNESIFGLCVGGLDLMFLAAEQQILIEYEGERIPGRCRSAARFQNGKFQIGVLKTDDDSPAEVSQILINSYMDFEGCKIVCIPVALLPSGQVRVRLLDGKEFEVDRHKIIQMTRAERLNELGQDLNGLGRLLRIYSAFNRLKSWNSEEDILEQEFGPNAAPVLAVSR